MADRFDPYYTWLGIPPEEQPPDHYRLLGVRRFESNDDVIANAADQRMAYVRTFQSGKRSKESQALLNEIAAARGVLLDQERRPAYDQELRGRIAALNSAAVLPLEDLPPGMPVAQPLAMPPAMPPAAAWPDTGEFAGPVPVVHVPQPPMPLSSEADAAAVPAIRTSPRLRRRGPSLATALVIGGGTFVVGLVTLIATLIWAASQ
jgi:hypothetical protein